MKPVRILQYKASRSAKALTEALKEGGVNAKRLKVRNSSYRGSDIHFILNWGSTDRRTIRDHHQIFNLPESVDKAQDKIKTFSNLPIGTTPNWTTIKEEALSWIQDGDKVYCRTLTRAREGRGVVVARTPDEIVNAPLYTRGLDIDRELRIHVFNGEVIDFVQKKRMGSERREQEGIEEANLDVRNHNNGWVFARADVHVPEETKELAVSSVQSLGLDFGAVDVVITEQGASKVLEINTAPGITGTTLENYKNAIISLLGE